jgi:hypothetical protein
MSQVKKYRDALHDPHTWIMRSVSLFQSAESVWNSGKSSGYCPGSNNPRPNSPLDLVQAFGFYKVAMMLYGMAVETALKGILIRNKSKDIIVQLETDGGGDIQKIALKSVGDSAGGHDLVSLAKNAGVISKDDLAAKMHLRELAEYVIWRGRYPVPKGVMADDEERERIANTETIEFVRRFLRQNLTWPTE